MKASEAILHGRGAPLARLRVALEQAADWRGQVALVSGEAGIGKSALAEALARHAEARGAVVTRGRAWEFAEAPPYFPLWSCFRTLGIDPSLSNAPVAHDDGQAFRLWEEVAHELSRLSSRSTSVWILEDLHAADLGTLDLLVFLAQAARAQRVLLVATARVEDPRLTERALQRLTRLAREGLDVRLEPLADLDVAALVEEILGRPVPASALRRIIEVTGGNPLFVTECARAFRAAGGVEGTLATLPPTVRQVLLERVELLPDATRAAVARGAILGREFSASSVARMSGTLPARVIDTLLPALRTGLLAETGPGQFAFTHALVRDAIDEALEHDERARLHGRAEAALAELGDRLDVLVERARHALAALPFGSETHALALAARATELLEREGAFDRASELHARVGGLERSGLVTVRTPTEKLRAAETARAAGRSDERRRLCEELLSVARASGNAVLLAQAALLHGVDVRPGVVDRAQVALFEEARAALGDAEPKLVSRVLARLATALQPTADQTRPTALSHEALERAHATNDDATILEVLELAAWGLYAAPSAERIQLGTELLERSLAAGDRPKALMAYGWLSLYALEVGDFDAFITHTERMLVLSDQLGHPRHRWRPLLLASSRATSLGHFAESDRYVTEVAQLAALIDDPALPLALAMHDVFRKRLQRRDDELPTALESLTPVLDGVWEASVFRAIVHATCFARTGDVSRTRAELASLGARSSLAEHDAFIGPLVGEALALAGSDDDRRRFRRALGTLDIEGVNAMACTYEGTLGRVLGLLDASLGELASAEKELRRAHELAVLRAQRPFIAQTAYELGTVLGRAGRADEAKELFEESRRVANELGMPGLVRSLGAASASTAVREAQSDTPAVTLTRVGEIWTLACGERSVSVKDSRGIRLLERLLLRPGEEIHVLALASDDGASLDESHAGELLDVQAERAYRKRISELGERMAQAEVRGDAELGVALSREHDALAAELRRALGLGGRARRAGSATERARVSVQKRVKEAIARVSEADTRLGRFLENGVSTGTFCCFRPKPDA